MKLFVSWDGSDPDCFEGDRLTDCLAKFLDCYQLVDDDMVHLLLSDMHTFAMHDADKDGRIKKKFLTTMGCSAEWCYGYDSFEEAFDE